MRIFENDQKSVYKEGQIQKVVLSPQTTGFNPRPSALNLQFSDLNPQSLVSGLQSSEMTDSQLLTYEVVLKEWDFGHLAKSDIGSHHKFEDKIMEQNCW